MFLLIHALSVCTFVHVCVYVQCSCMYIRVYIHMCLGAHIHMFMFTCRTHICTFVCVCIASYVITMIIYNIQVWATCAYVVYALCTMKDILKDGLK